MTDTVLFFSKQPFELLLELFSGFIGNDERYHPFLPVIANLTTFTPLCSQAGFVFGVNSDYMINKMLQKSGLFLNDFSSSKPDVQVSLW